MRKPVVTLSVYLPSNAKKAEIKRKAKAQKPKRSVSKMIVDFFDSLPDEK